MRRAVPTVAVLALGLVLLTACGAAPIETATLSGDDDGELVERVGRTVFASLAAFEINRVLLSIAELDQLLDAANANRARASREAASRSLGAARDQVRRMLSGTELVGVCLQGARSDGSGMPGLTREATTFDRIFLVAARADHELVAFWTEGAFVVVRDGARAFYLERIEVPRVRHSDLEIGGCEVSWGRVRLFPGVAASPAS